MEPLKENLCCSVKAKARIGRELPSSMAAINPHITRRHETARITYQKHGRPSILLWDAQFVQHVLLWPVPSTLRELLEQCLHHRGHNVAGRDGVDAYSVYAPFGGEVAGKLQHAGFGGVIGGTDETLGSMSVV